MDKTMLTDIQIENWRKTLLMMIGPAAMWLPREEIERFRDAFQQKIDALCKVCGGHHPGFECHPDADKD